MFTFLSSATARIFSRRSYFSSSGNQNLLGAAAAVLTTSTLGFLAFSEGNNDSFNSTMRLFTTQKTLAESKDSEESDFEKEYGSEEEMFHGQVLKRQMRIPVIPYPLWDYNWDGKMTSDTSLEAFREGRANPSSTKQKGKDGSYQGNKKSRKGKTRHLLLVRHGQYHEKHEEDEHRRLTPLGRLQAIKTGKRLAEMARGSVNFDKDKFNGECPIKAVHVSNMVRAKETAQLIAEQLDGIVVSKPDPNLNEALPAPMVPIRPDIKGATKEIDEHGARIEEAFQKYFYRDTQECEDDDENDEFEIIVCHGNVIRYLFCRALQLPPEAWLRMSTLNCSITYLVIRPNGMVSARTMGDIGHLDYDESSFSGYNGFKW